MLQTTVAVLFGALALTGPPAFAGPVPVERPAGHLFQRTPRAQLRDLSTDRPDKTESPYTVDAGWVQVEMDLASFTHDRHNTARSGEKVESWSFATTNFKLGLTPGIDLQIVVDPFTTVRTSEPGHHTRASGAGDLTVRTKFNLWGNNGGPTALALMPFINVPTAQDDLGSHSVEGGLIIPLAIELPGGWGLGLMTELDILGDADGRGHHAEWVNTITLSHDLTERLGAYMEFFSAVSAERRAPWVGTFDVGFTYAVTSDLQLDCGVNIGLTRSADDINPFVGFSWRF